MLGTSTPAGLHEFVARQIAEHCGNRRGRAIDLGAGSGAFAVRLRELGFDVLAVDRNARGYKAHLPFLELDLNRSDFAEACGLHSFSLVVAIEVIEHVESPIGFLRNVGKLLTADGLAFITTPNVDNLPARVKFLLRGKIRAMDESSEPTHISPIFLAGSAAASIPGSRRAADGSACAVPAGRLSLDATAVCLGLSPGSTLAARGQPGRR